MVQEIKLADTNQYHDHDHNWPVDLRMRVNADNFSSSVQQPTSYKTSFSSAAMPADAVMRCCMFCAQVNVEPAYQLATFLPGLAYNMFTLHAVRLAHM